MESFSNFRLVYPWVWIGGLFVLVTFVFYLYRQTKLKDSQSFHFGHISKGLLRNWKSTIHYLLPWVKLMAMIAIILAASRPQRIWKELKLKANAIDIFMVMDLSSSMLAQDFQPDRLTVSKQVAQNFVNKRKFDRLGLSVFAGESYTRCPLTTDHDVVIRFLNDLSVGKLEDGTAIGMGLSAAVNRLKSSTAKSKIIILLTDGVNNSGYIDPRTAAQIAKEFQIKIYTVGVGSMGEALTPVTRRGDGQYVFAMARVEIDEQLMTEVSEMTQGKYYRATDEAALQKIYDEINKLEKTEVEVTRFTRYTEIFHYFLGAAICLLIFEYLVRNFVLRQLLD